MFTEGKDQEGLQGKLWVLLWFTRVGKLDNSGWVGSYRKWVPQAHVLWFISQFIMHQIVSNCRLLNSNSAFDDKLKSITELWFIPNYFLLQNLPTNDLLKGTVSKSNTQTSHIGLSWKEEQFWVLHLVSMIVKVLEGRSKQELCWLCRLQWTKIQTKEKASETFVGWKSVWKAGGEKCKTMLGDQLGRKRYTFPSTHWWNVL